MVSRRPARPSSPTRAVSRTASGSSATTRPSCDSTTPDAASRRRAGISIVVSPYPRQRRRGGDALTTGTGRRSAGPVELSAGPEITLDSRHSVLRRPLGADGEDRPQTRGAPSSTERAIVARERPTASNVEPLTDTALGHVRTAALPALTCAEAHALRRSAPLTPEQFAALRRRAELGISPLSRT
jgi:hypothetical protein